MNESVAIARPEHKACSKLEGIFPKLVLLVAGRLSSGSRFCVVAPEDVKQISRFQGRGSVGFAFSIHQQGKRDTCLITKQAGITHITESHSCQSESRVAEVVLVFAQLRDVLAAEDSAPVAQKDHRRRPFSPERAQLHGLAVNIRKRNVSDGAAE